MKPMLHSLFGCAVALAGLLTAGTVHARTPAPGGSVFGKHQYTEYVKGEIPVVLTAPHGGRLTPEEIPDRTHGVVDADANTQELARVVAETIHKESGRHPHLVICRLHRRKLDANRDVAEAAQGSELAKEAWQEYHTFIRQACDEAVRKHGVVLLIDLHGHGHPEPQVELGYLHSVEQLNADVAKLNAPAFAAQGSLAWIAQRSPLTYAELLYGPQSFGALLEERGFPATPSPRRPAPSTPYFRGGFTVFRHCEAQRGVTGFQIEANRPRLRDTAANRLAFARALTGALEVYLPTHLGLRLDGKPAPAKMVRRAGDKSIRMEGQ